MKLLAIKLFELADGIFVDGIKNFKALLQLEYFNEGQIPGGKGPAGKVIV